MMKRMMSPQLAISACASVLAMAALALLAPAPDDREGLTDARQSALQVKLPELPRAQQLFQPIR